MRAVVATLVVGLGLISAGGAMAGEDVFDRVEHHYADSDGVKIHYTTLGSGPAILFVHGFPDFWYTWRDQMAGLSDSYTTVAMDMRGYNKSDKPEEVGDYAMNYLLADVAAVIDDLGQGKVILVGHDWGGAICWRFAMEHADKVDKLVICNLTHPKGYANVIANATEEQRKNTNYARNFASSEPGGTQSATMFLGMVSGESETVKKHYKMGLENSNYDSMINYYRANYGGAATGETPEMPNLTMPVLQFHGLQDTAVDKDGLMRTWDWIDKDYTLVTLPDVGHWVQRDGSEVVTNTMKWWLQNRK